jgi:hypothetical protein
MPSTELKRADFLAAAQRWLSLAHSYEISERLSQFNEEFKARSRSKE